MSDAPDAPTPRAGHNSDPGGKAGEYVRRFVKLFEDQKEMADEIRDLATEAKDHDLDPKVLKELAKQQMDPKRREAFAAFTATMESYRHKLGVLD